MSENAIELWHAIECPYSMRVRLMLREKNLDYASHVVKLADVGEQVRRKNPKGAVPVIEHLGCVVYETNIIAEFLEEQFPTPVLFPADPRRRARTRLLMNWCDAQLVPPVMTLEDARPAERLLREPTRDEALQDALQRAKAVVRSLATVLGNHSYLSEQCGIADLYFAPFVTRLDAFGVRRDEIPAAVATWIDRLRDRPSVAAETARWEEAIALHETGT